MNFASKLILVNIAYSQIFLMSFANSRIRIGFPAQNLDRKVQICILIFCKFSSSFLHPVCQLTSVVCLFLNTFYYYTMAALEKKYSRQTSILGTNM